ncbi:MAG: hypothetical protein ACOYO1_02585 [Bacteroidales bacterium]
MQIINTESSLKDAISQLEIKREEEGFLLKYQFHLVYESMKPINLIKNTFKEVAESEELKDDFINTTIGLTAGYISKKIFEGATNNPLKKIIGTTLMFGVKKIVAKNPEIVKSMVHGLFNVIRRKLYKENDTERNEGN